MQLQKILGSYSLTQKACFRKMTLSKKVRIILTENGSEYLTFT